MGPGDVVLRNDEDDANIIISFMPSSDRFAGFTPPDSVCDCNECKNMTAVLILNEDDMFWQNLFNDWIIVGKNTVYAHVRHT